MNNKSLQELKLVSVEVSHLPQRDKIKLNFCNAVGQMQAVTAEFKSGMGAAACGEAMRNLANGIERMNEVFGK